MINLIQLPTFCVCLGVLLVADPRSVVPTYSSTDGDDPARKGAADDDDDWELISILSN